MTLISIGDSFTYGEELADLNNAWPHLLATKLNSTVNNLGLPATGNTSMVRNAVKYCGQADLMVIAWSHYARIELADANGVYDIWPGSNERVHNQSPYRKDVTRYISRYHNDEHFYQQYLINILLTQGFLKQHNQRYIMVNSFGNNWNDFRRTADMQVLANQIDRDYFLGWPYNQMVEWTYKCPQGPNGHFLDEGHQRVAEKIYEHIRYLGWVS